MLYMLTIPQDPLSKPVGPFNGYTNQGFALSNRTLSKVQGRFVLITMFTFCAKISNNEYRTHECLCGIDYVLCVPLNRVGLARHKASFHRYMVAYTIPHAKLP